MAESLTEQMDLFRKEDDITPLNVMPQDLTTEPLPDPYAPEMQDTRKQMAKALVENVPVIGEVMLGKEIVENVKKGNLASAGLGTAALSVGILPGGDILNKPIKAAAKKLRKKDADVANKMLEDVDSIKTWKKQNPNPKPQKQNPDVEKAANDLLEGNITGKQYRSIVKENMPIVKIEEVPEVPSFTEIVGALDKDKSAKGILGLNKTVKDGTRVASRLDIPAYERFDKWVVSVHDAFDKKGRESLDGDIMGYGKTAILKNVEFKGMSQGAARISSRREDKGTIARIFGDYYNAEPENVAEYAAQAMKDKNWTQVGYNPFRHGFFYDKDTGMPVKSAEEVIQVGPLVLAKNAQKMKISEAKQVSPKGGIKIRAGKPVEGLKNLKETKTVFNKGGAVPMKEQMSMFEDGGLMDEGGTVDPVSGNDVPPGSTQEEVRDDIPAQLSEGEFVFPADVVRYWGLDTLMRMRQEAKMGLQIMEQMGQMGNADEATIPDDVPFDINDLDMEDEEEYNYQVGGFVPGTAQQQFGIAGYQAPVMQQTGVAQIPQQQYTPPPVPQAPVPQMQPFARPQQQAVPTMQVPEQLPTFQQAVTPPTETAPENREYINPETGERRTFTFINNQPITEIPAGFIPMSEYTAAPTAKTQTTQVKTTQVTEDDDQPDDGKPAGKIAFGGSLNRRGGVENHFLATPSFEGIDPFSSKGRMLSSMVNTLTSGKIGTPLTLKEGESVVLRDIEIGRPYGLYAGPKEKLDFDVRLDDTAFNKLVSGKKVTERKELENLVNFAEEIGSVEGTTVNIDDNFIDLYTKVKEEGVDLEAAVYEMGLPEADETPVARQVIGAKYRDRTAKDDTIPGGARPRAEITTSRPTTETTVRTGKTEEEERQDEYTYEPAYEPDIFDTPEFMKEGGLASKKKPKPKRMKRGGLASKK